MVGCDEVHVQFWFSPLPETVNCRLCHTWTFAVAGAMVGPAGCLGSRRRNCPGGDSAALQEHEGGEQKQDGKRARETAVMSCGNCCA